MTKKPHKLSYVMIFLLFLVAYEENVFEHSFIKRLGKNNYKLSITIFYAFIYVEEIEACM